MHVFASRIRALLDAHPIHNGNVSSLARAAGIPQPTASRVVSGRSSNPHVETIRAIAKALGVTEDQIFDASDTPIQAVTGKRNACPVVEWSSITMTKGKVSVDESDPIGWAYSPVGASDQTFVLMAENDAMAPDILQGDTLFIDPVKKAKGGDVVLAFAKGETRPYYVV